MDEKEQFIKIPIGIYRDMMLELQDKAYKDFETAKSDIKKIEERKKMIRKYNKDISGDKR